MGGGGLHSPCTVAGSPGSIPARFKRDSTYDVTSTCMLSLSRSRGGTRRQHHYFETTPEGIQRLNPPGLISFLLPMLCQSAKPKAKGQAQGRPCPVLRSEYCLQARVSSRAHAAVVSLYICVTGSSSRPAAARLAAREGGTEDTLYIITLCN